MRERYAPKEDGYGPVRSTGLERFSTEELLRLAAAVQDRQGGQGWDRPGYEEGRGYRRSPDRFPERGRERGGYYFGNEG